MVLLVKPSRFWNNTCFNLLTRKMKQILTVNNRQSFFCDSHVWLCYCCHGFREKLKFGVMSKNVVVVTRYGLYMFGKSSKIWRR